MSYPRLPGILRVFALISATLLSACASEQAPPPRLLSGDQILRESQGMAQIGQRHREGENMMRQGEDLIKQGRAQMAEGERMIGEGRRIISESEQGYGELKR